MTTFKTIIITSSVMDNSLNQLIDKLNVSVNDLCSFFELEKDFNRLVSTSWTAKNVLGHLTFWHESFARNVKDLAANTPPSPLKGKLSEVNARSVDTTSPFSVSQLIVRIKEAQTTIVDHISSELVNMIPYKKGSRDYSKYEHLEIVSNHINKHLKQLVKVYQHD